MPRLTSGKSFSYETWNKFPQGRDIFMKYVALRKISAFNFDGWRSPHYKADIITRVQSLLPHELYDHVCWFKSLSRVYFVSQPYCKINRLQEILEEHPKFAAACLANDVRLSVLKLCDEGCGWHFYGTLALELSTLPAREVRTLSGKTVTERVLFSTQFSSLCISLEC